MIPTPPRIAVRILRDGEDVYSSYWRTEGIVKDLTRARDFIELLLKLETERVATENAASTGEQRCG